MPGPSGLDLQAALQRQGVALPVVFLTGHADVASSVRAMKAGAVDFLTKPVERDTLFEALQRALARDARAARRPRRGGRAARAVRRADAARARGLRRRRRRQAQQADRRRAGDRGAHRQAPARAGDGQAGRRLAGRTRPAGRAPAASLRLLAPPPSCPLGHPRRPLRPIVTPTGLRAGYLGKEASMNHFLGGHRPCRTAGTLLLATRCRSHSVLRERHPGRADGPGRASHLRVPAPGRLP